MSDIFDEPFGKLPFCVTLKWTQYFCPTKYLFITD